MRVNSLKMAFNLRLVKIFAAAAISFCVVFLLGAFVTNDNDSDFFLKRVNIALRAIAHNLLLRSGDSTSVVPPVIEKSKGVFIIEFNREFTFQPDTLVAIVQQFLSKTELSQYTVTVYECNRPDIVYGFEINPPLNNIEACRGRSQPEACYNIEIAFANFPEPPLPYDPVVLVISGILFVLAVVVISGNVWTKTSGSPEFQNTAVQHKGDPTLVVGKFLFDVNDQTLTIGEERISLTDKECRVLTVLHRNIGRLTSRDELIQEVWTDEGVITGRSLDMFISKLRKKLSSDPDLRIMNVHGKGYRLEREPGNLVS